MKKLVKIVDPPSGWMYGFPRIMDHDPTKETVQEWFLRHGYPQKLIDKGMLEWCRSWFVEEESK